MFAIIDLEFTSWKGSFERDWKLSWEKREIIQIGAVKFKSFNGSLRYKNIYVKPKINKKLSLYIQKLTKINQNIINTQGKDFKFAIEEIDFFVVVNNLILSVSNSFLSLRIFDLPDIRSGVSSCLLIANNIDFAFVRPSSPAKLIIVCLENSG